MCVHVCVGTGGEVRAHDVLGVEDPVAHIAQAGDVHIKDAPVLVFCLASLARRHCLLAGGHHSCPQVGIITVLDDIVRPAHMETGSNQCMCREASESCGLAQLAWLCLFAPNLRTWMVCTSVDSSSNMFSMWEKCAPLRKAVARKCFASAASKCEARGLGSKHCALVGPHFPTENVWKQFTKKVSMGGREKRQRPGEEEMGRGGQGLRVCHLRPFLIDPMLIRSAMSDHLVPQRSTHCTNTKGMSHSRSCT